MLKNTPTFQNFWDAYGLKRDRIAAERAWNRLTAQDRRAAVKNIAAYKEDCERRGISRMYAQGYINHRRWEDDFTTSTENSPSRNKQKVDLKSDQPSTMGEW